MFIRRFCVLALCLAAMPAAAHTARVIDGDPVHRGDRTYQVALVRSDDPDDYTARACGGTLISRAWVVTAAHCVDNGRTAADLQVLTGTNKLDGSGVRHPISSITIHPRWNRATADYDVALLHLGTHAEPGLQHAALITASEEKVLAAPGDKAVVSGWGSTAAAPMNRAHRLQQASLPIISNEECAALDWPRFEITARMLCAGFPHRARSACHGDSGGPLVVADERKGGTRWLLAGVVSWGKPDCASPGAYTAFARIAVLRGWINRTIKAAPYGSE